MAGSATGDDGRLELVKDERDFQDRFDTRNCCRNKCDPENKIQSRKKEFCEIVNGEDVIRSY